MYRLRAIVVVDINLELFAVFKLNHILLFISIIIPISYRLYRYVYNKIGF